MSGRRGNHGRLGQAALLGAVSLAGLGAMGAGVADRPWVSMRGNGKLAYRTTARGDRIMDFSAAGYGGGGVKIPLVPVVKTISPSGQDDMAAIQAALDEVSKRPLSEGFRGALLLRSGTYSCSASIKIRASGVILRGEGSGPNETVLKLVGKPHQAINIENTWDVKKGISTAMTDKYVPSGATTFHVASVNGFQPGDDVWITRPTTEAWVHFMGMDKLVRSGKKEHWVAGDIRTKRKIKAISGNEVMLDVPLTDSFDAQYLNPPGGTLVKFTSSERMSHVGVEGLRITAPPQHVTINDPLYTGVTMSSVADVWVRDVELVDTTTAVHVGSEAARVTVQNVGITHSTTTQGAAKPADFVAEGTQVLFDKCRDKGNDVFYFVTGARATGPIVLLNCVFHGGGWIQPHQRWATGLLVDSCQVPEGGIEFMDRGIMGSGHGWTIGWAVAWNCVAKSVGIQMPPGAINWAIGCRGEVKSMVEPGSKEKMPEGVYESQGRPVAPASLYLAQLAERAGPDAVKAIGY